MNKLMSSKSDLVHKFCTEIENHNGVCNLCPTELVDSPDACTTDVISFIENYTITIGGSLKLEYTNSTWYCEIHIDNFCVI